MKVYNLTSGTLYANYSGEECYCVLGIYAAEKVGPEVPKALQYELFSHADHVENMKTMAAFLEEYATAREKDYREPYEIVYSANDRSTGGGCSCELCVERRGEPQPVHFMAPVEKIREALALVGIEVELKDMR